MDCGLEGMRLLVGLEEKVAMDWLGCRVSTGIPGYGLRTEMIRKFFPFPLWKRFRKTGIPERFPERFFFVKRKFPEYRSGNFRFPEHLVPELH